MLQAGSLVLLSLLCCKVFTKIWPTFSLLELTCSLSNSQQTDHRPFLLSSRHFHLPGSHSPAKRPDDSSHYFNLLSHILFPKYVVVLVSPLPFLVFSLKGCAPKQNTNAPAESFSGWATLEDKSMYCTCNTVHVQQAVILLKYVNFSTWSTTTWFSDYRKTPLRSHPLLGQWIGQPEHGPLPHGILPSTRAWSASEPQKDWYSHLPHRDCFEDGLNSTFHHQPLTPSLVPTAKLEGKPQPSQCPQQSTCFPSNSSASLQEPENETLQFGLCLRKKLCGGLRGGSSQNNIMMAG